MWFWVLIVLLLVGAVGVVATGRWGQLREVHGDRPDATLPSGRRLTADDLRDVRLTTGLRGYRMDEVDALLDRLQSELPRRDEAAAPAGQAAAVDPDPTADETPGGTTRESRVASTEDGVGAYVVDDEEQP